MPTRYLRVLDAANQASDRITHLIDAHPRTLLHTAQLRRSSQSIPANIAEALGRRTAADRAYRYEVARGEARETITHLASNFRKGRLTSEEFFPVNNLLQTVVKMLTALLL